jgi:hypothetical protein
VGADEIQHARVGGGWDVGLSGSLVETRIKEAFCPEELVKIGFLGD